ncbi:hypothetical protein ACFXKW_32235 [Streptomyces sp. NPDC059193]|uniref:hypothetical protein n=1 Tax=Streptomyces sp. NPDC059193 TaxID=3346763 RepID=UPI003685F616
MDDTEPTQAVADTASPEAASTSSTPKAGSPAADFVTELGERILVELGEDRTNSTLTRWLSHHTAGLIDAADRARAAGDADADARAAVAREAILQLWQARTAWPSGWPPPGTTETVRLLDSLPDLDASSWYQPTVLAQLHDLHHRILGAIVDLATHDEAVDVEQAWLDSFGDHLEPF